MKNFFFEKKKKTKFWFNEFLSLFFTQFFLGWKKEVFGFFVISAEASHSIFTSTQVVKLS
jgi:hypothetical protein